MNRQIFKRLSLGILTSLIETDMRLLQVISVSLNLKDNWVDIFYIEDEALATALVKFLTTNQLFDISEAVVDYMVQLYNTEEQGTDFMIAVSYFLLESWRFDHL